MGAPASRVAWRRRSSTVLIVLRMGLLARSAPVVAELLGFVLLVLPIGEPAPPPARCCGERGRERHPSFAADRCHERKATRSSASRPAAVISQASVRTFARKVVGASPATT